jgi:multiple sugar transport system permease protein
MSCSAFELTISTLVPDRPLSVNMVRLGTGRLPCSLLDSFIALLFRHALVLSLNIFDQVYILNGIAPLGSSVMLQTYVTTFENLNFGGGYALSLLMTLATALLSMAALALLYRRAEAV